MTPRALALERISTRLRDETAWAILLLSACLLRFSLVWWGRHTQQRRCGCA